MTRGPALGDNGRTHGAGAAWLTTMTPWIPNVSHSQAATENARATIRPLTRSALDRMEVVIRTSLRGLRMLTRLHDLRMMIDQ